MHKKTIPFTKKGYENIQQEYQDLNNKRKEAVEELSRARDMGDRSENAAYKSARQTLSGIDSRLRFLNKIIQYGYVYEPTNKTITGIGCHVNVDMPTGSASFELVGEYEADPMNGKLSYKSPVGQGLLRKKAGDTVTVLTPAGPRTYTITSLSW